MSQASQPVNYLQRVKDQYEDYPYPLREPKDEKSRLVAPILDCFDRLNHYGFGGQRNFYEGFRALVAGGGTGDAVTMLAEQLRDTDAEIVYIDLSSASMEIAKARVKARGLDNVTWHQASILDIPGMALGQFDYINCSGVLHHLEDPDAGLAALTSALKDDGVMGLMVYGQYGRTGVYQMQELMRLMMEEEDSIEQRIQDTKSVLQSLPKTNWFQHNGSSYQDLGFGDIGIYDLLLHSQDRAYSIPELYAYVEKQGLNLLKLLDFQCYDAGLYTADQTLLDEIHQKDEQMRYAIGELLSGLATKHTFYVSKTDKAAASVEDEDMVPCLPIENIQAVYQKLAEQVKLFPDIVNFTSDRVKVGMKNSPELLACLGYMDGQRSLGEIYELAAESSGLEHAALKAAFTDYCNKAAPHELVFLRHKDVPRHLTLEELEAHLK